MAGRKSKANDKGEGGSYVKHYQCVLRSEGFSQLSAPATKLFNDLMSQYYGSNNGDLCASFKLMKKRNWKSKSSLSRAIQELLNAGFIELSREGGRNLCHLYALTTFAVDECNGKLDIKPKSLWRKNEPVQDIKQLQQQKLEKDNANFVSMVMDRAKNDALQNSA